jgi:rhamnogalacturonyl hydrolase YesR
LLKKTSAIRATTADTVLKFPVRVSFLELFHHIEKTLVQGKPYCMKKSLCTLAIVLATATMLSGQSGRVFSKGHIKKSIIKAARWQLKNPKHELYDWTNGAFYAGLFAAWEVTKNKKLYKALLRMGQKNDWKPGKRLQHADDYAISQTYIDLYRAEKNVRMILPTIDSLDKFMAVPYPAEGIKQIAWWWCDALFMAPPAMVKLSVTSGSDKYMRFSDKLFRETHDLLFDQQEHLFYRDLRYVPDTEYTEFSSEANGKKIFWGRGNGWVLAGLARVLDELPEDYSERPFYIDLYKKMAARIAALQQGDGLWRASLLDPEAYPGGEASGSGFYVFALAWGINNGVLDRERYIDTVRKGWAGLNTLLQDGVYVGWVQPIGADPRSNFSAESWEVYGTGAFLLAGCEVYRLVDRGIL